VEYLFLLQAAAFQNTISRPSLSLFGSSKSALLSCLSFLGAHTAKAWAFSFEQTCSAFTYLMISTFEVLSISVVVQRQQDAGLPTACIASTSDTAQVCFSSF